MAPSVRVSQLVCDSLIAFLHLAAWLLHYTIKIELFLFRKTCQLNLSNYAVFFLVFSVIIIIIVEVVLFINTDSASQLDLVVVL